jgi:hypothetical protein
MATYAMAVAAAGGVAAAAAVCRVVLAMARHACLLKCESLSDG